MQRTGGELEASQRCRREHPCDRGTDGDYGQHGHQRVARDEDEYEVGDDLYMHAHKIVTWPARRRTKEERAYVHIMQICNGARMHASHRVHMAYTSAMTMFMIADFWMPSLDEQSSALSALGQGTRAPSMQPLFDSRANRAALSSSIVG